jgi:hypothetical protein
MKQQLVYTSADMPPLVQQRLMRYFESAGYKTTKDGQTLVFRRGSFLAGLFTFSPKRWHAVVTARVATAADGDTAVTVDYNINTTGQTITSGEAMFWEAEMAGLQRAIVEGSFDPNQHAKAEKAAVSGNWAFLRSMLLGGLLSVPLIVLMIAIFYPAMKLARSVMGAIMHIVPLVGSDAAGFLLVVVALLLVAITLLFQEASPAWSGWISHRLPARTGGLVARGLNLVLYYVVMGIVLAVFATLAAILRSLHSPYELWWWGLLIVGVFVLAIVADRREKNKRR